MSHWSSDRYLKTLLREVEEEWMQMALDEEKHLPESGLIRIYLEEAYKTELELHRRGDDHVENNEG